MNFAVVKFGGKQHLVSEGSLIVVTGNLGKVGDKVTLDEVLLYNHEGTVTVGTPLVKDTKVFAEVVSIGKGEKIRVAKFKAKSRYRRVMGFRPLITTFKVLSIGNEKKVSDDTGKQPRVSKGRAKKSSKV